MSKKLFDFDSKIRKKKNVTILCGIDETGRGCWAGPLVAACVIFNDSDYIDGVNDSKKLSERLRLDLDIKIKSTSLGWGIAEISAEEIDKKGITFANNKAMIDAAKIAAKKCDLDLEDIGFFIIDQSPCKNLNPQLMMPKADSISASVAAASIIAKNHRDKIISEYDLLYPEYFFSDHKGYINSMHVDVVNKHGLLPKVHRKSFSVTGFNKPKQINLMDFINEN